jgi:ATP-binding cassette, subfamily B, bacterial
MSRPPDQDSVNRSGVAGIVNRDVIRRVKQEQGGDPLEDRREAPLSFSIIRRLLSYTAPYRRKMQVMLLMVALRGVQLPLLAWALGAIIDGPIARGDEAALWTAVGWFVALAVFTEVTFHFRVRLSQEIGERVIHDLRSALFRHWMRLTMSYFQSVPVGRMISRLTGDAENVRVGVQSVLFVSMVSVLQMITCAALMLWTDWRLFLAALGVAPLVWLLNRVFHSQLSAAYRAQSESFSRISATMAESVSGVRVTQSFSRQEVNAALFHELVEDHARFNFKSARAGGIFLPLLELSSQVFMAVLVVLGGWLVLADNNPMSLGTVIQFFFLAGLFFQPIVILGNVLNEALTAMAGAEKLFHVLDTKPAWEVPPDAVRPERLSGQVVFDHVTFSHVAGRPALREVSFSIPAGTSVAVVGATGSGKTTLTSLVARFHLPDAGTVRLDGHDTRVLAADSIHRSLGMVPQQNYLFIGTVLDNIRLTKPGASVDEVKDALRQLDCLDVLEAIPGGLNAEVGEHGAGLSLGQRQVICFARALLANPSLLILDEATSAVDPLTEQRTQEALRLLLRGRTSFIVAHRLSTIRHVDHVLVLEEGRLVEQGPPELLLRAGGPFSRLWAAA